MTKRNPRDKALRLLAVRDRTEQELRERFLRDGYEEKETEDTLLWLKDIGYIDDAKTAKGMVEYHNRFRPLGRRGLEYQLRRKGVDNAIVDEVLNSADKDFDMALELAGKRAQSLSRLPVEAQKRRLASFLQRRGFSWDIVRRVIAQVLGDSLDTNE